MDRLKTGYANSNPEKVNCFYFILYRPQKRKVIIGREEHHKIMRESVLQNVLIIF